MPLISDHESDDEKAERLAEEERHRVFAQRVRAVQAQQEQARLRVKTELRKALDLLDNAPGDLLTEVKCERAVAGVDLRGQQPSPPSLGGQTPQNTELVARQEAARERGWEAEKRSRERWISEQDKAVHALQAGQEPSQQRAIAAAVRAQKRGP